MVFENLNDGRSINLVHVYMIEVEDNKVIYKSAKGSLDNIEETFATSQEAENRFNELKESLT